MSIQGKGMSVIHQLNQGDGFSLFYSPEMGFAASILRQGKSYEILGDEIRGLDDCLGKSVAKVQKYLSYTQFIIFPVTSNSGKESLSLRFSLTLKGGGTNYSKGIKQSERLFSNLNFRGKSSQYQFSQSH